MASSWPADYLPGAVELDRLERAVEEAGPFRAAQAANPTEAVPGEDSEQEREYRRLRRKWWFGAAVGIPTMVLSYSWIVPVLRDVLPRGTTELRVVWALMGIASLAVLAEARPVDKAKEVKRLPQLEGGRVGMVGDGIDDTPALAQADVGFSIATGKGVAIEAADVTLISGSLRGVVMAVEILQATMRNVYRKLFGAFVHDALGIPVSLGLQYPFAGMLLSPLLAALAKSLSSVTVITSANRLKLWKPKGYEEVAK